MRGDHKFSDQLLESLTFKVNKAIKDIKDINGIKAMMMRLTWSNQLQESLALQGHNQQESEM